MTDISHTLIIGGSSGMGFALAARMLAAGQQVTIAGRSSERLDAAATALGTPERLQTHLVDIVDEDSVQRLFADLGPLDHVVVTAVDMSRGYAPLADFALTDARTVIDIKVLGPWLVAKHAGTLTGSLTVTSGIAAYRPGIGGTMVATANAALEGLVRALALELAPLRVNAVSPGWVDTAGMGPVRRRLQSRTPCLDGRETARGTHRPS
ncbi:SDR family oxidoreductase [Nocardia stercoris]|uniref:SDR family oxidoreductase n=1 Tax=Nocardia stercoris TaxID=2483361 RepID=UPI0018F5C95C|nr:SDR family oxidoreductase [Nocardia stercoris]